jgi:UDP-glucose 4-epimerase
VRAIVTGGAGFIGSHVVDALLTRGDEVVVIDNLSSGSRDNVAPQARLVELDIRDAGLAGIFGEVRPDICFHLAAQADVVTSVESPDYDAEVNVIGTLRVLQAAGEAQLVFTSTGGALYGECERPATEDDPRRPLAPYGASKLAGEEYLAMWNRLHGTGHVSLRLGNVYGPRQAPSLEGGVVAIFLDRMSAGEETVIFGDGGQSRDFVYVGDVADAVLAAVGSDGGVYNIGTGADTSIRELHEICSRVSGTGRDPTFAEARPGEIRRSVLDPSRAGRALGWQARTGLEDGLHKTLAALAKA